MKTCQKCSFIKEETLFYKDKYKKDGLDSFCKSCRSSYHKKYRKINKEALVEYAKTRYSQTKEAKLRYQKEYTKANAEQISEKCKKYYLKNKERIQKYKEKYFKEHKETKIAEYKQKNKDKIKTSKKLYREENKDKTRKQSKRYFETHPEYAKRTNQGLVVSIVLGPKIKERDNYTCQLCNNTTNLIIHHITPKIKAPELIAETSNLITLCKKCHLLAHDGCYTKLNKAIAEQLTQIVQTKLL